MKFVLVYTCLLFACSRPTDHKDKIKNLDSLYNKAMFNDTYFRFDTSFSIFDGFIDTQYFQYMYDYVEGVRNIHETLKSSLSDTIMDYGAFYTNGKLFKIHVTSYLRSKIGTRSDYPKSLYYFDNDTLLLKDEHNLSLDLNNYRKHFESLAKKFNDTLKIK